jgi:hypothetical protein
MFVTFFTLDIRICLHFIIDNDKSYRSSQSIMSLHSFLPLWFPQPISSNCFLSNSVWSFSGGVMCLSNRDDRRIHDNFGCEVQLLYHELNLSGYKLNNSLVLNFYVV